MLNRTVDAKPYQTYDYDNPPNGKINWLNLERDIVDVLKKYRDRGLPAEYALLCISDLVGYHTRRYWVLDNDRKAFE